MSGYASDPAVQAELARLEATEKARASEHLREVLSTSSGRAFVWDLIARKAGAFEQTFERDPLLTAHSEGRRSIGVQLLHRAQAELPDIYVLMLQEELRDQRALEGARRRAEHLSEDNHG